MTKNLLQSIKIAAQRTTLIALAACSTLNLAAAEGISLESKEPTSSVSEEPKYNFDLYGFVRTDFYYNSRDCASGVNDIFNLYPLAENLDANGEDLNAYPSSSVFAFITRLGLNVTGPNIGNANTMAKIEVDFGGYSTQSTLLRIRHAYVNLNWDNGSGFLMGQTWHPLFGEVFPTMANISTGAPFQPFSRSPQLRYTYKMSNGIKFTAAALWQLQYLSNGPDGKSLSYQAHSCIPEFYASVDYYTEDLLIGLGVDAINIKPRTQSTVSGSTYKVDELMSAVSGEVHMRYRSGKWNIAAKSIYASALDHTLLLGGYAVTAIDSVTGEQSYTPLHNSTSWLNITYGETWRPSLFVGYTKNLGANEEIAGDIYGNGTNIDQLFGCNVGMSYRRPSWTVSLELSTTGAWYGDINSYGKVENSSSVFNNRIVSEVTYLF